MSYPTIYPYITQRLQDSVQDVPTSEFDGEIVRVLRRILAPYGKQYPDVSAVAGASGYADKDFLDEAVGLTVAHNLLVPYLTGGADSPTVSEKTETAGRAFADDQSEREKWLAEAGAALNQISFIAAERSAPVFFGMNGPKRCRTWGCCDGEPECCE